MSLFFSLRSLFRHPAPAEAEETQAGQAEAPAAPPAFRFDPGMPVEVMKDFDTVLLFGRLAAAGPVELSIGRIPGEDSFPACKAGSVVLVRGYDSRMDPVLLRARVVRSSGMECVVGQLEFIPYKTPRKDARYPLTPPANVYALDGGGPEQSQLCQLLNISTGGACIVSEHSYRIGQPLCLRVELVKGDGYAVYRCRVVRVTPRRGSYFEYGLLFSGLDRSAREGLAQNIQAVQRETEEKLLP